MGKLPFDDVIQLCSKCALKSSMQHKHGAVVVSSDGKRILGTGYNYITERYMHTYSCHAEVAAIQDCLKKVHNKSHMQDATLVVVRIGGHGEQRLSNPCKPCRAYIEKHGIRKVFYST